jgi:hypothetical protein
MARYLIRTCALAIGFAAALAHADFPPPCEDISRGPRIILEPIILGGVQATLETSTRAHSAIKDAWAAAMIEKQPGLPLPMYFDDCWSYRQRVAGQWGLPHIVDFNTPRVRTMKVKQVVAVAWGIAVPPELRIDLGLMRVLASDPPERERVVRIKVPTQPPPDLVVELAKSNVLTVVGVLGAIDLLLDDFEISDRIDDPIGASKLCWRRAIVSQIRWAEISARALIASGENPWISDWIGELRDRASKARGKANAICAIN